MKQSTKFKIGDVLSCIDGKKTSNEIELHKIKRLEVISLPMSSAWEKARVRVRIVEGGAKSRWGNQFPQGHTIELFDDCLEFAKPQEPVYEVF